MKDDPHGASSMADSSPAESCMTGVVLVLLEVSGCFSRESNGVTKEATLGRTAPIILSVASSYWVLVLPVVLVELPEMLDPAGLVRLWWWW